MARGFGTSLGVGGTDKITTALDHITAARTYVVRIYRNGAGGGNFGRIFGNSSDLLLCDSAGNFLQFNRGFSTTGGAWKGGVGVGSTLNAPYVVGLSHDGSTSAPTMYRNGLGVAVTTITAPVGSITLTSSTFLVGNVAASTRVWDGYISDFYVFDSVLTAKEHEELASNIGALWRPRRIWVPVSAASGPPTLAAIAASDLTASGARLTVT